jgi:outer membrane protein assembly factor BamB
MLSIPKKIVDNLLHYSAKLYAFSIIFVLIAIFIPIKSPVFAQQLDWPMSAGNPQRTSHNDVEVSGNLSVDWYRTIDPYIDNKSQVIAADGKIFVSTTKGLYAFMASDGSQLWTYGTELPLGNSPTYYNSTLYVGGFDHKIHAINSTDGKLKIGWTFYEAGAGFDTNPLVINDSYTNNLPVVFIGNRDGNLYALDGNTGVFKWKFQTAGPIKYSPAYKNGIIYLASDDAYAYAINATNGSQVWKSTKLPGVGFTNYWPVIYTDKTSNTDYVIFSGSKKSHWGWLGDGGDYYFSENISIFGNNSCTSAGTQSYYWATGTQTLDCSITTNYFTANPHKRSFIILNRATGQEFTPYAPIGWASATYGGNKHPPVVGKDGVLYTFISYNSGGNGGAGGWLAGWKFGTSIISKIHSDTGASDEPGTFSSGGNLLYWAEGVNHDVWGTIDTSKMIGNNFYNWQDLRQVTGASAKYTSLHYLGLFGGPNGAYSNLDGLTQMTPIPYNNKLYLIHGNVLFALSSSGVNKQLALVITPANQLGASISVQSNDLKTKLANEVQKMLTAGHLRPGYYDSGGISKFSVPNDGTEIPGDNLPEYFHNPADTVTTLVSALPYLSTTLQTQVKSYLSTNYGPNTKYSFMTIAHIGWNSGAKRESYDDTPELTAQMNLTYDANSMSASNPRTFIWYPNPCCSTPLIVATFPQDSFYGAWKYAQTFSGTASSIFDGMKSKLQKAGQGNSMTDANLIKYPYILNQYINGYRGYLELEKLAGRITNFSDDTTVNNEYIRLVNLRVYNFSKDVPSWTDNSYKNAYNVARNFMYMTPELGEILRTNKLTQVQDALNEFQILTPYWFVSKYDRAFGESIFHTLYDTPALFQAKSYILKQPFNELVKYLDVPAFATGDLFYIQDIVAALSMADTSPTGTLSLTPTTIQKPGDANNDNIVDGRDYVVWLNHFGQAVTGPINGDFDNNNIVDGRDYVLWLNNYGK